MGELNAPFTSTRLGRIGTGFLLHPSPAVCAPLIRGSSPECSQKKGVPTACFLCSSNKKTVQATPFPLLTSQGLGSCGFFFTKWGENKSRSGI